MFAAHAEQRMGPQVDMSHVLEGETTTVSRELQDLCTFEFEPFKNGLVSMSSVHAFSLLSYPAMAQAPQ